MTTDPRAGVLVIGVGNEWRGDDSVGLATARRVRDLSGPRVRVVEEGRDGASLLDVWAGAQRVWLIDAAVSGAAPGTVRRLDAVREGIPVGMRLSSSHLFGVAEGVELARGLDRLPPALVIFAIEGRSFDPGADMTPEVHRAADDVAARIIEEIEAP